MDSEQAADTGEDLPCRRARGARKSQAQNEKGMGDMGSAMSKGHPHLPGESWGVQAGGSSWEGRACGLYPVSAGSQGRLLSRAHIFRLPSLYCMNRRYGGSGPRQRWGRKTSAAFRPFGRWGPLMTMLK